MIDSMQVTRKIADLVGTDPADIDRDAPLFSLVNSSFRIVELVIELQEEFGVRFHQADMNRVSSVGDLIDLVVERQRTAASG